MAVEAAGRLPGLVSRELKRLVDEIPTSPGVTLEVSKVGYSSGARDEAGRRTSTAQHPMISVQVAQYGLELNRWFPTFVSLDSDARFPIALSNSARPDFVEFRIDEVHPEVQTSAALKITTFTRRVVGEMLEELNEQLERR